MKKMLTFLLLCVFSLYVSAKDLLLGQEEETYKITGARKTTSMNLFLDFEEVKTGERYENVYIAKYCPKAQKILNQSRFITMTRYIYGNKEGIEDRFDQDFLREKYCYKIKIVRLD